MEKTEPNTTKERESVIFDLICYGQIQRDMAELSRYGETREEIIKNLREHLNECKSCRERYQRFLVERVRVLKRAVKKLAEKEDSFRKFILSKSDEELVRENDERILDFFK